MILDWQPKHQLFTLHVPRDNPRVIKELMQDHGLDFSLPASSLQEAVLYTREPYAACAFASCATPGARTELAGLCSEISTSWALEPKSSNWPGYLCPGNQTPYLLQLADLEYANRRSHTLIADEPGVGKTPTAIMYANLLARTVYFRALAIVPASIRLQWAERIRAWSTIPGTRISVVTSSQRGVPPNSAGIHWTILSYECARMAPIQKAILANHYDLLVLDEAHYLKSPSAGRTRAIFGAADRRSCIASRCSHILALSGTPIPNRPREAYTLAKALCFEAIDFISEQGFGERFNPVVPRRNEVGQVIGNREGVGRVHELQARLRACFMVRHLKRAALPQLRLPMYDLVYADETLPVRAALEAERLLDIDPETFTDGLINGAVSTARKIMGIALAPQVARYVGMLHNGGVDKIVLFYWHIEVGDILQKALDKFGVVRVDGSTSEGQKAKAVVRFQSDKECGFILGNVLSLGTGTDGLQTVCDHVVVAEPDWVMGNNQQMVDRLDRGGQVGQVQADFFVARGSLAERILGTALRKGKTVHKALDARL